MQVGIDPTMIRTFLSLLIWTTSLQSCIQRNFWKFKPHLSKYFSVNPFLHCCIWILQPDKTLGDCPNFWVLFALFANGSDVFRFSHGEDKNKKAVTLHNWELFIILFTIRWCHHSLFISCTQTSTYFSHITIHYESRTRNLIRETMKRMHRSFILVGCAALFSKTMAEEYTVECQQDRIVISFDQQYLQGLGGQFLSSDPWTSIDYSINYSID